MEKYSFKVHIKGAEPGGYISLQRRLRPYLSKSYPGAIVKLELDYLVIKYIGKEEKNRSQIELELRGFIDESIRSWKKKGVTIEDVTERALPEKQVVLTNFSKGIASQLEGQLLKYQDEIGIFKSNEDHYIVEIGRQEEIISELGQKVNRYEKEDRKYIKEVDLENKQLRGEAQEAKLTMIKIKHTVERFFKSAPKKRASLLDSVKKALGEGCSNQYQILDYLTTNNIHTSDAYLRIVLYKAVKNKDIVRPSRGQYSLPQVK